MEVSTPLAASSDRISRSVPYQLNPGDVAPRRGICTDPFTFLANCASFLKQAWRAGSITTDCFFLLSYFCAISKAAYLSFIPIRCGKLVFVCCNILKNMIITKAKEKGKENGSMGAGRGRNEY